MFKAKKLSDDRKDLLESIGFVWSERQSSKINKQVSWDERLEGAYHLMITCNLLLYFIYEVLIIT